MKKIVIASLCFILAIPLTVSAEEPAPFVIPAKETTLSAGFEFGNTIEHGDNIVPGTDSIYFGSPGMNVEGYSFRNGKNFGMFFHGSWTFPAVGDDTQDFQTSWLIGPAFRVRFTDKLTLQTGLGISANRLRERFEENGTEYFRSIINFGIGADAGLKFDITDKFFIKGGVNAAWSFLGWTNVRENNRHSRGCGERDRNIMDIWTLTANPYISFGVNIYSPRREIPRRHGRRLGKPPREEAAQ
ncbi:hypothetical protein AGMMS49587_19470 [Spirochaetia bacterium]|nr:hypothetical protein AGMMS49587_19470 [Spirochaetia bacterium]